MSDWCVDFDGKPLRFVLDVQGSETNADCVVPTATGAPKTAMIPSPVNLSTVPPNCCTTAAQRLASSAMISRSRSALTARRDVHRMHDVGEQNGHLPVLR